MSLNGGGRGGDGPGGDGGSDLDGDNYPLRAFKSTPYFIEALTDLGVQVLSEAGDKK